MKTMFSAGLGYAVCYITEHTISWYVWRDFPLLSDLFTDPALLFSNLEVVDALCVPVEFALR